jgi:hypothetical protein
MSDITWQIEQYLEGYDWAIRQKYSYIKVQWPENKKPGTQIDEVV